MANTLADLKSACVRELWNRTDLATEILASINSAVGHYQKEKFWFTEEQTVATTVANQASLGLPSDHGYIDGITIVYSTYPIPLIRRDWEWMLDAMVNTTFLIGLPTDYAIHSQQLWFWPMPNAAYALTMWQNMQNAPPTQDTDSNNWTTVGQAEELIRARTVADVRVNIIKNQLALQEFAGVADRGFYSLKEKIAFDKLHNYSIDYLSSRRIR